MDSKTTIIANEKCWMEHTALAQLRCCQEWNYIKKRLGLSDTDLVFKGGFWYVG